MDVSKEIRQAIVTGNVFIGADKSLKTLKRGQAKLVIVASNVARDTLEDIKHYSKLANVKVHFFDGDSAALGLACGKPFSLSVLTVIEPGNSNVLSIEAPR